MGLQLCFQLFVLRLGAINRFLCLLLQPMGEAGDQFCQLIPQRFMGYAATAIAVIQLLQIPVNGGFGAGITHLDSYGINARVFTTGQNCRACNLHHRFVYAAASHGSLLRLCTVVCIM